MLEKANQILIQNIKARMELLGLKVSDLAKGTGLSASGLYGILDGTRWPQPDNLDRIARALKTTVSALFRAPDEPPPEPSTEQCLHIILSALADPDVFAHVVSAIEAYRVHRTKGR